jgi:myosin-crossreactive antigen
MGFQPPPVQTLPSSALMNKKGLFWVMWLNIQSLAIWESLEHRLYLSRIFHLSQDRLNHILSIRFS